MSANADKSFDANETVLSDGRGSLNNSEKGSSPEVFRISKKKLEVQEVYKILKKFDAEKHTHVKRTVAARPGHVYIFYAKDKKLFNDYTTDNFIWVNRLNLTQPKTETRLFFEKKILCMINGLNFF